MGEDISPLAEWSFSWLCGQLKLFVERSQTHVTATAVTTVTIYL